MIYPIKLSDDLAIRPAGNVISHLWEIFTYFDDNGKIIKNQYASSLILTDEDIEKMSEIINGQKGR